MRSLLLSLFLLLFSQYKLCASTIGDFVWYDLNRNALQDPFEPGMADIRLILYDANTNYPIDTTYSDMTGHYHFTIGAGYYYVVATEMAYGYIFTLPNIGFDEDKDNDACPMGRSTLFFLTDTADHLDMDFGLVVDNVPCGLSSIVCLDPNPISKTICFDQFLDFDDSISSFSSNGLGTIQLIGTNCIEYIQNPGVDSSTVDTIHVDICNGYGDCHQVCLYASVECAQIVPPTIPCNDSIYTCLAVFPSDMNLCVPSCLVSPGDHVIAGSSTFHCQIVINSDTCVTYSAFPGMPYGYIDTVTLIFENFEGHQHAIKYFVQIGCINDSEHAPQWVDPIMNTNLLQSFQTTIENECVTFDIKALEVDILDQLNYSILQAKHGFINFNSTHNQVTYCPNYGFIGQDTMYLMVCDSLAPIECDELTIFINVVGGIAPPPLPCNDTIYTCTEIFPGNIKLCVDPCLWNVGDTIRSTTTSFNCSIDAIGDSCRKYTPLPGMIEGLVDTVKITLCSSVTGTCHTIFYVINIGCADLEIDEIPFLINPTSLAPITFIMDTLSENHCNDISIKGLDFDINDSLSYNVSSPSHGTATYDPISHTLHYCPDADYVGEDSVLITVCDSISPIQCTTIPIFYHVEKYCMDTIPICVNVFPASLTLCPSLCNITSVSSQTYSSTLDCIVSSSAGNCYTYYPVPGQSNLVNYFSIISCDAIGNCDTTIYKIFINTAICPDETISAINDTDTIELLTSTTINVLHNDTAYQGQVNLLASQLPTHGTATINTDNTITYINTDPTYTGLDCFSYIVCNAWDYCDTANVCILIENNYPITQTDFDTIFCCSNYPINVLQNDLNIDTSNITLSTIQSPVHGTLSWNDSIYIYNADPFYNGLDSFQYQICNSPGICDTAWVYITIFDTIHINHPPVFVDSNAVDLSELEFGVTTDSTIIFCFDVIDLGDSLTYSYSSLDAGSGQYLSENCFQYTPQLLSPGTDTIYLIACDSLDLCDTLTVILHTTIVYPILHLYDDIQVFTTNTPISFYPVNNDTITSNSVISIIDSTNHGTISISGNTFTYQASNSSLDTLIYMICDTVYNTCDTATVYFVAQEPPIYVDCTITNFVSPNYDGVNDFFVIPCIGEYPYHYLGIYNRWGSLVYESYDYKNDWNGLYQKEKTFVPDGTYYYIFVTDLAIDKAVNHKSGFIYLKR